MRVNGVYVALFVLVVGLVLAPYCWGLDVVLQRTLRVNAAGIEGTCAFGDISGDTNPDIVVARQSDEWGPPNAPGGADADCADFEITWRRNDGTNTWPVGTTITYTAVTIPNQYYNNAHGGDGQTFNGNDELSDVKVADVDSDGHNDIVACTLADGIFWFRNQTPFNGTSWSGANAIYLRGISPNTSYPNVRRVFPVDVDDDGDLDIVAAISESSDGGNDPTNNPNAGSKLSLFWNNGSNVFTQKIIDIDPNLRFIISCHAADLVNATGGPDPLKDDKPELIVTTLTNDVVRWYKNNGGTNASVGFTGYLVTNAGDFTEPWDSSAGDFNSDGRPDIVAVSEGGDRLRWFENNGALDGTNFLTARTIDTRAGGDPHYVQAVDIDANGRCDVLASYYSTNEVIWYDNNGGSPPTWTARIVANASNPLPADTEPENIEARVVQKAGSDDPYVDLMVGNIGTQTVSFYNNLTYNYGPSVQSISMRGIRQILVTFSMAMNLTECTDPNNYTVSGPGMGTLSAHPATAVRRDGTSLFEFVLTWNSPQEMKDNENITVTVADGVHENDGVPPSSVPIHEPKSGSAIALGLAPIVSGVVVIDPLNIDITFSEAMASPGVLTATNYMVSGGGALMMPPNPNSVVFRSGTTYRLTWTSGEMSQGGTVRITADNVTDLAGNPIGDPNWGEGVGIGSRPAADSIVCTSPNNPTNATTVSFDVVFSEDVKNFNNAFDLVITEPGVTHSSVAFSGGPKNYTVTILGMAGNGSITLAVSTASDVMDLANNPLLSSVTSSPPLVIDQIPPNVSSVTVLGPNPTYAPQFTVSFDEAVQLFNNASDLTIGATGSVTYTGVNITGGPTSYTVSLQGTSGVGSVTLQVNGASDIRDLAGNALATANPSATVQVDTVAPNAVNVQATTPSPTNGTVVSFTVQFDKSVLNFNDEADLVITEVGITHGAVLITGSGQDYGVQISGVSGTGTIQLAVSLTSDVQDAAGNLLASSDVSGVVIVDNVGPHATSIVSANPSPTNSSTIVYDVQFDEDVQHFDNSADLVITETDTLAHTGVIITPVTASRYTIYVTGITGNGDMTVAVKTAWPADVTDLLTNPLVSSVTSSPITVDVTGPSAITIVPAGPNPTKQTTVPFTVTFNEPVQRFNHTSDLVVTETGTVTHGAINITGGPETFTVNVTTVAGNGSLSISVDTTSDVADLATNPLVSSVTSAAVVIDNTNPTTTVTPLVTKLVRPLLSGTMGDNVGVAGVQVTINSDTYAATLGSGTWGLTWPVDLAQGTYDVVATATDTVGNTGSDGTTNELTVDLSGPLVTVTSQITNDTTPIVSGTVVDNVGVATVRVTVDGFDYDATIASGAWSIEVTHALPQAYAQYDVAATGTDTAGNTGTDSTTNELTIDPEAPSVYVNTLLTSDPTPTMSGSATCLGSATDIISVNVSISGYAMDVVLGALIDKTRSWTATVPTGLSIPDGTYDIVAVAMDNLARSGSDGTTNELTVDTQPPVALFLLTDANPTTADQVHFTVQFNEPVTPTFGAGDVSLTGSMAGAASFGFSGTDPIYTVTVTLDDPQRDGTIGIALGTAISDVAGNGYPGGSSATYRIRNWYGFTQQPQGGRAYEGSPFTFTVAALFGSSTPIYQWKWDDGLKTIRNVGTNSPVYTISNVAGKAGTYWCSVSYDGAEFPSNAALLEVAPYLQIDQQPENATKPVGESHTFTVVASGGFAPIYYQWYHDSNLIPGATNSAYTIGYVQPAHAGAYYVEVSDDETAVMDSNQVQLTVGSTAEMPVMGAVGAAVLSALILALGVWLVLGAHRVRRARAK